jgi:hypothetical protein
MCVDDCWLVDFEWTRDTHSYLFSVFFYREVNNLFFRKNWIFFVQTAVQTNSWCIFFLLLWYIFVLAHVSRNNCSKTYISDMNIDTYIYWRSPYVFILELSLVHLLLEWSFDVHSIPTEVTSSQHKHHMWSSSLVVWEVNDHTMGSQSHFKKVTIAQR